MTTQSELFLGMDWSKVPEELKDKTLNARRAFLRLRKAREQLKMWTQEVKLAEKDHEVCSETQADVLNRWNPDTNEIKPMEEISA